MKIIHKHLGQVKTSIASPVSACHVRKNFHFFFLGDDDIELVFTFRQSQTLRVNLHCENGDWGVDPEIRLIQHYHEEGCPPVGTYTRPFDRADVAMTGFLSMTMGLDRGANLNNLPILVQALRIWAGLHEVA